ncbi:BnaAnng03780D [Brassica napus]|uniref:BnaAnng03780D protein n=1 Tax=Brassica napus TaxID=3708 RepID=A0A078H1F4_BRANA|nr:BnaAnng03780D [Brassica napus]
MLFVLTRYAPTDPVFAMGRLMISIQRDMVMLENQIPLFVLDKLLELQPDTVYQPGLVAQLALTKRDKVESVDSVSDNGELHCLDVFHRSLFKSTWTPDKKSLKKSISSRKQQLIHCVTELKEAGVKFRRKKTDKLWDIEFRNGYLKIPKLLIHDSTKSLFSNLIAFEQCHANSSNDITSYIIFMDNLINSAEDYFNNPWAYFSFFAALVLLILTLLQSFFAVYAYYKPSS